MSWPHFLSHLNILCLEIFYLLKFYKKLLFNSFSFKSHIALKCGGGGVRKMLLKFHKGVEILWGIKCMITCYRWRLWWHVLPHNLILRPLLHPPMSSNPSPLQSRVTGRLFCYHYVHNILYKALLMPLLNEIVI